MHPDLDLLSEALPHQIAAVSSDKRLEWANAAFWERHPGVSRDSMCALSQALSEEVYAQLLPFIDRALRGEKVSVNHTFPNPRDGRAWTTSMVPRQEGGFWFVSDAPDMGLAAMYKSQRTEDRLQAFVDFAPIGMAFSHLDGRILDANETFLQIVGYTREELEHGDIHWDHLTPPELLHRDYEAIAEAKETGRSKSYEKEYITKSGQRVTVLIGFCLVEPLREEAIAFVFDMSIQKQTEEEVLRLNAELEERVSIRTAELEASNKELEAFVYAVSHDLRAPLRSIDGFSYALSEDYAAKLDPEGKDYLSRIRGSAKKMDELISALLSLSRLTRTELALEDVNLSELAEASAADLKQANPDRTLQFDVEPNLKIRADRRLIRILIDNLLGNAVKFTSKQGVAIISVGQEATGAFFVQDNGVGFNVDESPKLFQPFERLHSPRDFSGSGIGLATVQRIVRKHGGHIWAEAHVDKGARFLFTL